MFTGSQSADGPFGMQAVGKWVIDRVNFWVGEQVTVCIMNARNLMFVRKTLCAFRVARGKGCDLNFRNCPRRVGQCHGDDGGRAKHTNADGGDGRHNLLWNCSYYHKFVSTRLSAPDFTWPAKDLTDGRGGGRQFVNGEHLQGRVE